MHQVLEINRYCRTSFLLLKNIATQTIDNCFDDSRVISENNFDFMEIGKTYQCRIMLFGNPVIKRTKSTILCEVINEELIGNRLFKKVQVGIDEYYIPCDYLEAYKYDRWFLFEYTRKDLIQVDGIIHADLLT